jgi:hypothetical protein
MASAGSQNRRRVQTTVRLPRTVYEKAKSLVDQGKTEVATFNELVVEALVAYIKSARRSQIDKAFAGMGADKNYQLSALAMSAEFDQSDWEAFEMTERT